jgi:hypothetical protein
MSVLMKVLMQTNTDIVIMDWEKHEASGIQLGSTPQQGSVAWRTMLVANEINEIQVNYRTI